MLFFTTEDTEEKRRIVFKRKIPVLRFYSVSSVVRIAIVGGMV